MVSEPFFCELVAIQYIEWMTVYNYIFSNNEIGGNKGIIIVVDIFILFSFQ